ncbi:MAG: acyl-CoA dehydrogenase family protein [Solirubrobacteraceae bacterium]|nr:acyl-CoA dehydrogenase family protein [Solirubrobacteraceae bacterium]
MTVTAIPQDVAAFLVEIDEFIEREIAPLEAEGDNVRFIDHRREMSRTDLERDGLPSKEWEALLHEASRRADAAGLLRYALPEHLGGRGASNLDMAIVREHLNRKPIGLHNDPQTEMSIIGNFVFAFLLDEFGTPEQKAMIEPVIQGETIVAFGLTEPNHGSDATFLETTATRDGDEWVINGGKRFNTGMHVATHDLVFARSSGEPGHPRGITAFLVPTDLPGVDVPFHWWTMNMPSDHAEVTFTDVRVPHSSIVGDEGLGLALAQRFVHENRIRQAASSLGAAAYCIDEAVKYARERVTWGKPLWKNQGIQFPLAELWTEAELLRGLIRSTAAALDENHHMEVTHAVAMCNLRANRLACDAADRAMQTCGGMGYTRHMPFEHLYRHHRRYRITEGSDEIQMRKIAQELFRSA